ncbi:beta-galactosidase [Parvularcula sp. ZS-1/3]|uniref:Beta-galactosidase n=1 Tax=Parvularcula mediterranea TaxID=2732508 RepID=A0A7Y3W5H6_9PROT|nr:beta-galactosidase [Parvularcula mediterranea]NNU16629.1 beta-galactosidase [Parvularcula mediterranea]
MTLGVCYYPEHWAPEMGPEDAKRMARLGLSFARIGEFAWAPMEPEPGRYEFGWLDQAIENLHAEGLEVMLGTPTATPPKWLIDRHDDILAWDEEGRARGFGSRRHYCFSSETYREHSRRITEVMAKRYGGHPAVTMWQTDNEFGCHETVRSYSPMARDAFRGWLSAKYGDVAALNEAWGNVFWSMLYRSFDEVELPNLTATEANPSHWLDFYRFSSDQVMSFHREQVAIIRQYAPDAMITHNAMGYFTHYDHHDLGAEVDVLTWDSYPLGFLAQGPEDQSRTLRYLRQGDPDMAGFHHDLYRGCAPFAVIEQQPGPVNWAPDNPSPLPGMVRLWELECLAHGGRFSSVFRWRQAPFAQEQNHAGMLRPDSEPAAAFHETDEVAKELSLLSDDLASSKVALLFDYDSVWMSDIQPQGTGYDGLYVAKDWYAAARKLGADVDIVPQGTDLSGYAVVLVPSLLHLTAETAEALKTTEARVVIGPRCGSKDENGNIPDGLAPGPLRELIPLTVARSETVPEGAGGAVAGRGGWKAWRDECETALDPLWTDEAGRPVLYREGRTSMFAALPERELLTDYLAEVFAEAGMDAERLPAGLRLRRGCGLRFAFNYAPEAVRLPDALCSDDAFVIGGRELPPAGVSAWRET